MGVFLYSYKEDSDMNSAAYVKHLDGLLGLLCRTVWRCTVAAVFFGAAYQAASMVYDPPIWVDVPVFVALTLLLAVQVQKFVVKRVAAIIEDILKEIMDETRAAKKRTFEHGQEY